MNEKPGRASQARTFVVRVVVDEQAGIHGQASEPGSADEWRVTSSSLAELWSGLERRLAPGPAAKLAGPPGGDPASSGDQVA